MDIELNMAFYNAVIVSPFDEKKILGRTLLTKMPSGMKVIHHSGRRIYRDDFKETLADPIKPMIITRRPQKPAGPGINTFNISVKNVVFGETTKLDVNHFQSIEDVKEMITDIVGLPMDKQRLIFNGKQLGDRPTLADYKIQTGDVFQLVFGLIGGGCAPHSFSVHDLKGQCVTPVSLEGKPKDAWKSFSRGLNMIGRCDDSSCKSTKHEQDKAIIKCGYSTVSLRPWTDVACPACDGGGFAPSDFILSEAKADLRLRKTSEQKVKSVIVESGKFPQYKMFSESEEKADYDWVEITAVPLTGSLCYCAVCSKVIEGGEKNLKMVCGHVFHQNCHELCRDCKVCQAQFIDEEKFENLLAGILK